MHHSRYWLWNIFVNNCQAWKRTSLNLIFLYNSFSAAFFSIIPMMLDSGINFPKSNFEWINLFFACFSLSIWWPVFNNIWYWKDLTIKRFYWIVNAATYSNNFSCLLILRMAQSCSNNFCCCYPRWNIFCKTKHCKIAYLKILRHFKWIQKLQNFICIV